MAAGWPTKANYATGDVLSATNMNDLSGTVNYLDPTSATDGQILTRDAASAGKVKWATAAGGGGTVYVAGKNGQLNSAMNVWQRGTSVSVAASTNSTYTADRYIYNVGANQASTVSRQATADTTNLPFIQYCARVQRNVSQTGTGTTYFINNWESINSIPYAGKTVTLSFYARAGANYSATSSALTYKLVSGTGTDQNESTSGFTGATNVVNQVATLTTTWQRFSYSGTIASTATQLATEFLFTPTGVALTNDYFEITGIQVEIASSASAFMTNTPTYTTELLACQRYYFRSSQAGTYGVHCQGFGISATQAYVTLKMPVTMRTSGGTLEYATLNLNDSQSNWAVTSMTINTVFSTADALTLVPTIASGLALYRPCMLLNNNSTAGYVGYSAEL